jgi:hypothetical protein
MEQNKKKEIILLRSSSKKNNSFMFFCFILLFVLGIFQVNMKLSSILYLLFELNRIWLLCLCKLIHIVEKYSKREE